MDNSIHSKRIDLTGEIPLALKQWRARSVDTMLLVTMALALPGMVILVLHMISTGKGWHLLPYYLFSYLIVILLTFVRKINLRIRTWGLIVIVYAVGALAMARGGLAGSGREYFVFAILITPFLLGIRESLYVAAACFLTVAAFAVLADVGILSDWLIYKENPVDIQSWMVESAYSFLLIIILLTLVVQFILFQLKIIEKERLVSARLEKVNQTLEHQVSERTNQFEEAVERAHEANRLKSEFLATMSHELRTPLNAVIGYSQMLLEGMLGEMSERQARSLGRILENAESLLILINDMLDLSKIEAGRMLLHPSRFIVQDWVFSTIGRVEGLAVRKSLDLKAVVDPSMPEIIVGDTERLRQVALNLLSNAIKFTDEGSVTMRVTRFDSDHYEIRVADTGIGISDEAIDYIFEEFRQVDGTTQRKFGGTGLGLAIVRNLVLRMSGTVHVNSKVGAGSEFIIRLPLITEVEGHHTSEV